MRSSRYLAASASGLCGLMLSYIFATQRAQVPLGKGVSPLGMASETKALAGWLEKRLAEEVSTATAYMLASTRSNRSQCQKD